MTKPEPLPREVAASKGVRVVVLGKPGCHLCDDATDIVAAVCGDARASWEEHSIEGLPSLEAAYGDKIPVVFVDGVLHGYWRVDPARLRKALG